MLNDLIYEVAACFVPLAIMSGLWLYASIRSLTARLDRDAAQTECIRSETAHTRVLTIALAGELGARSVLEFVRSGVLDSADEEAVVTEGRRIAALFASTASIAQLDAAVRAGLTRFRDCNSPRPFKLADRGLS